MTEASRVGAVLLAAGGSRRFGDANKLLAELDGRPLLTWAAENLTSACLGRVVVVIGDEAPRLREALAEVAGLDIVENPNHAAGMGTSIACGIRHLQEDERLAGAMIALADMPHVRAATMAALAAAFDPEAGAEIVVPVYDGRRGHPVLFARRFFDALAGLAGDVGGRQVIEDNADAVRELATDDRGIHVDVDTPTDLPGDG